MFHRWGGKAFIYIITLLFLGVSVQNTWQFLVTILPDATPVFLGCMMIVFEGGFLGWLALFMHGTENIPRTVIAGIMLVVTGIGVGTAAYYELDGLMHKSIAVKIDPGFLANVPNIVNVVYLATGVAVVAYALAAPSFGDRMRHLNTHGTPPVRIRQEVTGTLVQLPQTASTRQSGTVVQPVATPQLNQGLRQRLGNWLAGNQQVEAPIQAIAAPQQSLAQPSTLFSPPVMPDLSEDLAQSVEPSPGPFTSAPSPNGAKPNSQK
jgi:hypothetical protein